MHHYAKIRQELGGSYCDNIQSLVMILSHSSQNIGRPDYLKLEKIRAGDFAKQCKLSKPVSIDFVLD